jgi:hypothetical protein
MNRGVEKSFYVLMCGILGVLMFVILQQAVALMHYVLLQKNFETYSLGLSPVDIRALGLISLILAAFFGMWYGIWLGLYWFNKVYEQGGKEAGLVHSFMVRSRPAVPVAKKAMDALPPRPFKPVVIPPSNSSKPDVAKSASKPAPVVKVAAAKSAPTPKPISKPVALKAESKPTPLKPAFWDFDDLLKSATASVTKPKKTSTKSVRAVAKRAARKTARKVPSSIESV